MTSSDHAIEHRHEYETRLGMMGLSAADFPSADQHNQAVTEADAHIAALHRQEREDGMETLRALRDSI